MRILVTGGAGFIGSTFVHHVAHLSGVPAACCPDHAACAPSAPLAIPPDVALLNLDALTYAGDPANLDGLEAWQGYGFVKADIADPEAVAAAFKAFEPDTVVHFAAESHVDRSIAAGDLFVRTNVLGTQTLLDAARRHDVASFLHVSTDEVYGSRETGSFTEADPLDPSSPYSASKAGSDLLALAHHRTYGLPVHVTRCTNNFGPRQHPEKLVPKMLGLALRGEPLPVYGSGRQVRDWLYVRDHCQALLHVLAQRAEGRIHNVAAQDERTNLEVVAAILELTKADPKLVRHVQDRPGHDFRYSIDDARLRRLGWRPRMPFQEGLRHTLEALRDRPAQPRAEPA